jgi:hypothetical protein
MLEDRTCSRMRSSSQKKGAREGKHRLHKGRGGRDVEFRTLREDKQGGSCKLCHPRARPGYISLKRHSKATGGTDDFRGENGGQQGDFLQKSGWGGTFHGVSKLAMTARSRLGDYRKQSTNRQVISLAGFPSVAKRPIPFHLSSTLCS